MTAITDPNNDKNILVFIPSNIYKKRLQIGFKKVTSSEPVQAWKSLKLMLKAMREMPELGKWVFVLTVPKSALKLNPDNPATLFLVKSMTPKSFVTVHNSKGKEIWSNEELVKTDEITTSSSAGSMPNNVFAWGRPEDYQGDLTSFDDGRPAPSGTEEVDKVISKNKLQSNSRDQIMDSTDKDINQVIREMNSMLRIAKRDSIAEQLTTELFEEVDWSTSRGFEPEAEEIVKNLVKGLNNTFSKKKQFSSFKAVYKTPVDTKDDTALTASFELQTPEGKKKFNIQAEKDKEWNWLWKVTSGKESFNGSYPLQITRRDSSNIYKIITNIVDVFKKSAKAQAS